MSEEQKKSNLKYSIKKVDGKVHMITDMVLPDGDTKQNIVVVSEKFVKEYYANTKKEKEQHMNNIRALNRALERNKVEKDDELEHFILLANKARDYAQHMKDQEALEGELRMIDLIDESLKPIENLFPELKRAKKK